MQDVACCTVPFWAYLQDDGDWFELWKKYSTSGSVACFWLWFFGCNFLLLSASGKSGHLWRKYELEHSTGIHENHQPGKSIWDMSGLPNSEATLVGCIKDHYFVKIQKFYLLSMQSFCHLLIKAPVWSSWLEITTGEWSDERSVEFNCRK